MFAFLGDDTDEIHSTSRGDAKETHFLREFLGRTILELLTQKLTKISP